MNAPPPSKIEWWKPYPLVEFSHPEARSRQRLIEVIQQFDLDNNPFFKPGPLKKNGHQDTTCNIFLWAFSRAMGREIPHWVDNKTGAPAKVGPPSVELSANGVCHWLEEHGTQYGWRKCTETAARGGADLGHPTVATWWNHTGIGHVAAVRPSPVQGETWIAQSGGRCFGSGKLSKGFGNIKPEFYAAP